MPTMGLELVAEYLIPMARKASVPVCVHYDHGLTFEKCMEALRLGFTSVMYDCSTSSYEENVKGLAEMVRICHAMNVTVEGELGHVGDNEGAGKLANPSDYYTDPDMAVDFVNRTGIDSLAMAVQKGICKVNIFTDIDKAGKAGIERGLSMGATSMMGLIPYEIEAMKAVAAEKIRLFGYDMTR